jgi:uncharacterized protein DUF1996
MLRSVLRLAMVVVVALLASTSQAASAVTTSGQWISRCNYSHTLNDDPIVHPNMPGMSHTHDFYGSKVTDGSSTGQSLLGTPTTCKTPADSAGYWVPATYKADGTVVRAKYMLTYWIGPATGKVVPFPVGMGLVAGNVNATGPQSTKIIDWHCDNNTGGVLKSPHLDHPYDCTPYGGDGMIEEITFPTCWNGTGLTTADVTYTPCVKPFTKHLPKLTLRVHLGIQDPTGITLSSGPWWTLHADFLNAWDPARQQQLITDCIAAHVNCGQVNS